jgi:hypothetical protein
MSTSGQEESRGWQREKVDFGGLPSKKFDPNAAYNKYKRNAGVRTIATGSILIGIGAAIMPISSLIITNKMNHSGNDADYIKTLDKWQRGCYVVSGLSCLTGVITILAGLDTLRNFPLAKNIRIENRPGGFAIAYTF